MPAKVAARMKAVARKTSRTKAGVGLQSAIAYFRDEGRVGVGVASIHAMSSRSDINHLWDTEVKVFSQWGEDGILEFLCARLGLERPRALEFGAGNFTECNTRFLAEHRLASVMAVDARDDLVPLVKRLPIYWKTTIHPVQSWITPDSAEALMAKARTLMGGLDIVSLDIDGNDYWVLEGLDLEGVRIVVVEYNGVLGHSAAVTVPRKDDFDRASAHPSWLYYGASLRAWIHLMEARGFTLVGTNRACGNAFFCPSGDAAKLGISLPETSGDLRHLVDWRVRESRGPDGALSYAGPDQWSDLLGHLPLVDTVTGELTNVRAARMPD